MMPNAAVNWIYPASSIFLKRIRHVLVLSSITLTLFINDVQDILLKKTLVLMQETSQFVPTAQRQVKVIETIIPILEKLEGSRFGYLLENTSLPTTIEIKRNCTAVQNVGKAIPNISSILNLTGQILRYTTIFLAFQIAYSLFWIGMDLKKGDQKLLTIGLIVLAVFINYRMHIMLQDMNLFT